MSWSGLTALMPLGFVLALMWLNYRRIKKKDAAHGAQPPPDGSIYRQKVVSQRVSAY